MSDSALTAPADGGSARAPKKQARPGLVARTTTYVRQVVSELRKVIWPTRNELVTYTIVSLVFVTAMVALVALYDFLFTKGVLSVFG